MVTPEPVEPDGVVEGDEGDVLKAQVILASILNLRFMVGLVCLQASTKRWTIRKGVFDAGFSGLVSVHHADGCIGFWIWMCVDCYRRYGLHYWFHFLFIFPLSSVVYLARFGERKKAREVLDEMMATAHMAPKEDHDWVRQGKRILRKMT